MKITLAPSALPQIERVRRIMVKGPVGRAGARFQPWLHGYTVFTAICIFVLVCSGGLVTSKGAGLTVPDWPTSYGYNMFAFPISRWVGGVLYEHAHRLIASVIGLLTIGLAVVLFTSERRAWVRWLGAGAVLAVCLQGLIGGLRVQWVKDYLGIPHALLGQAFFALVSLIALVTSAWWLKPRLAPASAAPTLRQMRTLVVMGTIGVYLQLALGASMRHAHAGLSIPDFPTAYGAWWPKTDTATVGQINAWRDAQNMPVTSAVQIQLQMAHRIGALLATVLIASAAVVAWRRWREVPVGIRRLTFAWPCLVAAQVTLGIYTIWTNKAADVATLHVAVGALLLVCGVALSAFYINDARAAEFARRAVEEPHEFTSAAREVALA